MSAPPRRRAAPWEPDDLVRLVVLTIVAIAIIGVAWYGASGEGRLARQTAWLNLSVVGIVVAGAGNLSWMARGRRSVGERRRELLARWDGGIARSAASPSVGVSGFDGPLVRAAGMRFAHTPDCPLVADKAVSPVPADEAPPRCRICGEDRP